MQQMLFDGACKIGTVTTVAEVVGRVYRHRETVKAGSVRQERMKVV